MDDVNDDLEKGFIADIFNAMAPGVFLKLTHPRMFNCVMRGRANHVREIPFIGDETFRLAAAHLASGSVVYRIQSTKREEWNYIPLTDADMKSGDFVFTFNPGSGEPAGNWTSYTGLLERLLDERDDKSRRSYREMLTAALEAERKKIVKQGLASHEDFASW